MRCLLWRQHRGQLLWATVAVAAICVFMLTVARSAERWIASYHQWLGQLRAGHCALPTKGSGQAHAPSLACQTLLRQYHDGAQPAFVASYNFAILAFEEGLPLLLVIMGALVGAPVVAREIEQRTQLVSWTQSVTRRRWYLMKTATLAVGLAILGLIAGVANDRLQISLTRGGLTSSRWPWFFSIDLTPAAEALLAFALAVALGAWLRRTVAAIGAALVCFLILFLATAWATRTLTPSRRTSGARGGAPKNGWIIQSGEYHPTTQYWPLQLTYVAILLALVALFLAAGWRATRVKAI